MTLLPQRKSLSFFVDSITTASVTKAIKIDESASVTYPVLYPLALSVNGQNAEGEKTLPHQPHRLVVVPLLHYVIHEMNPNDF